ncbi:2-succinyl-6-hydroxy-2,4-cyclohexadiene-1-carboxylate synthase [Longibacter salinarum]|uniref:Putative 2-succinyl-6-hydroxy-2,4-cyclohexadiene-1-carboxylate synthase n=1 Tax=Longibacter salinarum TaxID=1850348 RepID=A0A2A8D2X7_9BACT|nr:2-succinyl-6-hydroxy-2,4-cyclohexadiene-1-carboxylate synthase [Longibacter salinarum]PEN15306.1 2-succinyl-6-hydroxy-2,4-cyclohexadiene-1-carboxylate synthase [Longibacter salinarum]
MLNYTTTGCTEKPVVCFLHGFMGDSSDWDEITDALSDDAHCIRVDLPGHGQSTGLPSYVYSMEGATQSLADVLDDAGIQDCHLVGYSMGGRVALYFAMNHPERVRSLVLESASPGLTSSADRDARLAVDKERSARIQNDLSGFLKEWYRMPLFKSLARYDLVESMITKRAKNDPDDLARALIGMSVGGQPSLWERLKEMDIPTLACTGALDDKYVKTTRYMAVGSRRMETVIVPDAGHNVHAERPQAFLSHLVYFLSRN